MAKHVIVGCAGLPVGVGWPRYFQRLPYLEVNQLHIGPVRPSVLKRWRQSVNRARAFGVVAPALITHEPGPRGFGPRGWPVPAERRAAIGRFRPGPELDHGVATLLEAVHLLDAAVVVFRTGPDFTPSSANRDLMRRFFAEVVPTEKLASGNAAGLRSDKAEPFFSGAAAGLRPDKVVDCVRVWQPGGLWDPPVAHAFAQELGIVCAHDPLAADPVGDFAAFYAELSGDDAYLIASGLGRARRHLTNDQLEQIAEMAARHQRAWVVMATNSPFPDAIRFGRAARALDHGDDFGADEGDDVPDTADQDADEDDSASAD